MFEDTLPQTKQVFNKTFKNCEQDQDQSFKLVIMSKIHRERLDKVWVRFLKPLRMEENN